MSNAAISIFAFSIYEIVIGIGFLFIPNVLLPLFKLPQTYEPWIRVVGVMALLIGFYHVNIAQMEISSFYWVTIYGRLGFAAFVAMFVVLKKFPPVLLLFGVLDLIAAAWTYLAMN